MDTSGGAVSFALNTRHGLEHLRREGEPLTLTHVLTLSVAFSVAPMFPDLFLKNPFLSFTGCWILVDSIFLPSRDNVHSHLASTISEEESAVIQTVFP